MLIIEWERKLISLPVYIFSFLFFTCNVRSQDVNSITFYDSETKDIVPYVRIQFIKTSHVQYANEYGEVLYSRVDGDSAIISCIGYKSDLIKIDNNVLKSKIIIYPEKIELNQVIIYSESSHKEQILGNTFKNKLTKLHIKLVPNYNQIYAVKIKGTNEKLNYIKEICFKIQKGANNQSLFRVHLYKLHNQLIGKSLLKNEIIISTKQAVDDLICINIVDKTIVFNDEGVLLGLEFIGFLNSKNKLIYHIESREFSKKPAIYLEKSDENLLILGNANENPIYWIENQMKDETGLGLTPFFWVTVYD
jgi:hypothetical protein